MATVTVRIKRSSPDVPLPARMTAGSAGYDLSAAVDAPTTIPPGEIRMIPLGFSMAIPPGYEAQLRPRSGLSSKFGITLINSPGTIDSDYRGPVHVPLVNHGKNAFVVERGARVAQMLILPVPDSEMVEVEDLDATERGHGGFGHTGH